MESFEESEDVIGHPTVVDHKGNVPSSTSSERDITLMLRFKAGDEDSFLKIVQQFEKPVINFAYKFLKDKEGAEDVAQEVFLEIFRKAKEYQPTAKLSTWIFTLARRKSLDYYRRRKIRAIFSLEGWFQPKDEDGATEVIDSKQKAPLEELESRESQETIRGALASLPEPQRTALLLAKYEDMPLEEVARIMKLSVGAVKQLLFRAKNNLKEELRQSLQISEPSHR